MKFILDENLPLSALDVITELGFEGEHVRTSGLRGASDERIAAYAKQQKAILVTKDLEFGSLLFYPEGSHYGLLILRVPCGFKTEQIKEMLRNFLKNVQPTELIRAIAIVQSGRYRFRKLS